MTTLEQLCGYITIHADRIAVRAQVNGKWGSYFLTELPPGQAIEEALKFVVKGQLPVVMKGYQGD